MSETLERKINTWFLPFGLAILLGLGGWNLARTGQLSEDVAKIKATAASAIALEKISTMVENGKELRTKAQVENEQRDRELLAKMDLLVSRHEFDARLLSVEARISECNVAIRALEVRMMALELAQSKTKP